MTPSPDHSGPAPFPRRKVRSHFPACGAYVRRFSRGLSAIVGLVVCTGGFSALHAATYVPPPSNRVDLNFNYDWKFMKKDVTGASATAFDDSAWTAVSLPHTWNDDKFREWIATSNSKAADPLRPSGTYYGKAWYRKHFTIDASYAGRKVILEFQGIARVANFYVNGQYAGLHENGVAPCGVDITSLVNYGADNVIAIQVNNDENYHTVNYNGVILPYGQPFNPNFGGLNRDVTLHICDKLYQTLPLYRNLGTVGTYVFPSNINTLAQTATLNVQAEVANDYPDARIATCQAVVVDAAGNAVLTLAAAAPLTIAPGQKSTFTMTAPMTGIHFWSPDFPYLYKVYTVVNVSGTPVDVYQTPLGVRKLTFNASFGLQINGHPLYLNGYAPRCSMEWPCVGTPVDWMNELDFKMMKENNANFVRPMHIAPRRAMVDAADKFGIILACPAANNEGDDTDPNIWQERLDIMRDVTIYFRNNPSVVFYEGCNQILTAQHMQDMLNVRLTWDPYGGRFAGLRSNDTDVTAAIREYSCTMDINGTQRNNPLWDAEYARGEAPRRVWDNYTPMLNSRWNGVNSDPTPAAGTVGDSTHRYLLGGYFYIASNYHQAFGLNSGLGDFIGDYLTSILPVGSTSKQHPYFRVQNSEDMVLQNLAKYYGRYMRSVNVQGSALSASNGVMIGGAKIIWSDSVTDGRMHDTEVTRVSGALDGSRLPKETFYGLQVAHNSNPQVYVVGHWNYAAGTVKRVYVAGNTATVKLQTFDANGNLLVDYGYGRKDFFPTDVFGAGSDQVNNYVFAFDNVAWQPGTVRAIGYDTSGKVVATHQKSTVGAPVALRLTPIVGPSGQWMADGSDIAMFDVEVVDAFGNRCPTYEDKVTFNCSGPGSFLGGYNSGIRYSTNLTNLTSGYSLNVECGINRVFVRATRTAGTFTLNVSGTNLTSTSASVTSTAVANPNGVSTVWPQHYSVALGTEPTPIAEGTAPPPPPSAAPIAPTTNITDLVYSGSNSDATITENAQAGAPVYMDDTSITMGALPSYLQGSEYIRPYQSDAGETSSTDQYQFNLVRYSYIYQLIDAANDMPNHDHNDTYQWTLLPETVTINGRPMKIYRSRLMLPYENGYFAANGDVTTNFDPHSNMYLVFIQSVEQPLQNPTLTTTASSTQPGTLTSYGVDGDVTTRWVASSAAYPQTYTVDLGRECAIGGYQINFYNAATRSYQYLVELSDDATTWGTSIDLRANATPGVNEYRVPDTAVKQGRYLRVTITAGGGGGWASFWELRVNGIPLGAPIPAAPVIISPTTATATAALPFTYQIVASNSPTNYSATGLPDGLTLDPVAGIISGTPTAQGTATINLAATNNVGTGSATVALTIAPAPDLNLPTINSPLTKSGTTGAALNYQITATDGPTSFNATPLPSGLTISTSTGLISGTPLTPGTTNVTLSASNGNGTRTAQLVLTVNLAAGMPPSINSPLTATGATGGAFSYQIAASNTPLAFSASSLPAGLAINPTTGVISGLPLAVGTTKTTISATNGNGKGSAILVITVGVGSDYNLALNQPATALSVEAANPIANANDGSVATRWAASAAAFPQWWQVDLGANKILSKAVINWYSSASRSYKYKIDVSTDGTAFSNVVDKSTNTATGDTTNAFSATARYVRVTISGASAGFASAYEFSVFGHPAPVAPVISSASTASAISGAAFSYQIAASNTPTTFAATGLPTGLSVNPTTGIISGSPAAAGTSSITISATNTGGTGSAILTLTTAPGSTSKLLSAVSRQIHGSAGALDLALPLLGTPAIETRTGAGLGKYNLVLTFSAPVSGITATLGRPSGQTGVAVGTVGSVSYGNGGTVATITLLGVANAQRLNVHLSGIQPGGGMADIPMNVLWTDVNGDGTLNVLDQGQVRSHLSQTVNAANMIYDVNSDGVIDMQDFNAARLYSGVSLP